jgi:hypothetical protein
LGFAVARVGEDLDIAKTRRKGASCPARQPIFLVPRRRSWGRRSDTARLIARLDRKPV